MIHLEILTKTDLKEFGDGLLAEIRQIINIEKSVKKKYLKGFEVKELLGISQGTLQNLRINGTLPYSKVGSIYFYQSETVEALMASRSYKQVATDSREEPLR